MTAPEALISLAVALGVVTFLVGVAAGISDSRNVARAAWTLGALALGHALIAAWWVVLA